MKNIDLTTAGWADYELLDSGNNRKLERYGSIRLIRPETQALWQPLRPELWQAADAEFAWADGKGEWRIKKPRELPEKEWELGWQDIRFTSRLTSFKHTGIFPEQAVNWEWIAARVKAARGKSPKELRVLNLFGYTGIASLAAAKHGAEVTHVDASKQSNVWAEKNAARSGITTGRIRFVLEDALKFAEREARRGASYDGIILDPPAFGRGPKKEVWKIEESLPALLAAAAKLLAKRSGAFFLLNGYAAGYSPRSFAQAVQSFFPELTANGAGAAAVSVAAGDTAGTTGEAQFGELALAEKDSGRVVPSGVYVRFVRS